MQPGAKLTCKKVQPIGRNNAYKCAGLLETVSRESVLGDEKSTKI